MQRSAGVVLLLLVSCVHTAAQGRVGVGASVTTVSPRDGELTNRSRVRPLIRLVPRDGWGVAGALNWFETDVDGTFAGVDGQIASLDVKPLLGGVGYTTRAGRVATTVSVVAGPSFNRLRPEESVRDRIEVADTTVVSLAARPGVGITLRVAPRVDIVGFAGYLFNRPKFTLRTAAGEVRNRWTSDAIVLSIGLTYALF